jgi:Domain of unknown function (DUF1772)
MLAGLIALIAAAAFAAAAFYINFAEHPARMAIPVEMAVRQWRPSYKRGFIMQSSLAVIGGLSALWQGYAGGGFLWLAGGVVLLANWPFTLLVIMPVNHRLHVPGSELGPEAAGLLQRWNRLHAVRTILGLLATGMLLTAARG